MTALRTRERVTSFTTRGYAVSPKLVQVLTSTLVRLRYQGQNILTGCYYYDFGLL